MMVSGTRAVWVGIFAQGTAAGAVSMVIGVICRSKCDSFKQILPDFDWVRPGDDDDPAGPHPLPT